VLCEGGEQFDPICQHIGGSLMGNVSDDGFVRLFLFLALRDKDPEDLQHLDEVGH
jgi:hypothetical protein